MKPSNIGFENYSLFSIQIYVCVIIMLCQMGLKMPINVIFISFRFHCILLLEINCRMFGVWSFLRSTDRRWKMWAGFWSFTANTTFDWSHKDGIDRHWFKPIPLIFFDPSKKKTYFWQIFHSASYFLADKNFAFWRPSVMIRAKEH